MSDEERRFKMFQAPSANDQAGCENETMVVGGFVNGGWQKSEPS
jgi:hypothetical protein